MRWWLPSKRLIELSNKSYLEKFVEGELVHYLNEKGVFKDDWKVLGEILLKIGESHLKQTEKEKQESKEHGKRCLERIRKSVKNNNPWIIVNNVGDCSRVSIQIDGKEQIK